MTKKSKIRSSLFDISSYVAYFFGSLLIITIVALIIVNPVPQNASEIKSRAIEVFIVVSVFIALMTILNGVGRRYTIGRPVKRILEATEKITSGDFAARIEPFHGNGIKSLNELDAIIDNFNLMAAELESVETIQTDFIATVSHEIKTPLTIIQNYATILQNVNLSTSDRQLYANKITEATERLSVLITNILKLNKLENQKIIPKRDTYLLNEQISAVLIDFEPIWEEKKLDISVDMVDVTITSDYEMLNLVWSNLISNAIKFNQDGGQIYVQITEQVKFVRVAISNDGVGIPEHMQQRIFDRFYQGDTGRNDQGNGLGLSLVKRVIDLLGGTIQVDNHSNTTFIIYLPKYLYTSIK